MENLSEREQKVYQRLLDEESRRLFLARKQHAVEKLPPQISLSDYMPAPFQRIDEVMKSSRVILYGYGGEGRNLLDRYYKDGKDRFGKGTITAVWDENANAKYTEGGWAYKFPLQTPPTDEKNLPETFDYVVITPMSALNYEPMRDTCRNLGIPEDKIILMRPMLTRQMPDNYQYFPIDLLCPKENEIFVDAGCFDFNDSLDFLRFFPSPRKIYAFEPDERQIPVIKQNIIQCGFPNVELLCAALWSSNGEIAFDNELNGGSASAFGANCTSTVKAVALDSVVPEGERISYIKMDIEGSELEALKGAAGIIVRDKPRLAICIYHKPDDYWEIPEWISSVVPEYRYYIRHYHYTAMETVLYAVI